jgi:hypothetical protein
MSTLPYNVPLPPLETKWEKAVGGVVGKVVGAQFGSPEMGRKIGEMAVPMLTDRIKRSINQPRVGRRAPKSRRVQGKLGPSTRIYTDGTTYGSKRMLRKRSSRKGKKKSTKQLLKQLKKNIPKMSRKTFRDFTTQILPASSNNRKVVYEIQMFRPSTFEGYIQNLTAVDSGAAVDYSTSNTSVKMDLFFKYMLKNNATANVSISYAIYQCTDDDSEGPLTKIVEELGDRGYSSLPSPTGVTAATATSSEIPSRLEFGSTSPYHVPVFGNGALVREWKNVTGMRTAKVGPGDTFDIVWSKRNFTYKPEALDQEAFTYLKGKSWVLVICCEGELSHDQTNKNLVGRATFRFDCERQQQATVKYSNPKGLNEVVYTDTIDDTNFTAATFADNQQSAIELPVI